MKNKLWIATLIIHTVATAQVTKVGNDTLIDVAGWNVEWFGDATNGPSNETLQYNNVKSVIANTDIDVWGLAEVSNTTTFANLLTDLSDYDGVNSSFSQTQKTAMVWKKDKFRMLSSGNVLTESTYNYAFAGGRTPLEVALIRKDSINPDTIYFYVVHLKANSSGSNQPNYDRRKDASGFLKTYLDQNRAGKKCIVLGDWNDDVDQSVVKINGSYLETPFANFVNDSAHYFFASMRLSKSGLSSYPSFNPPNMIDHQLISKPLVDSFYIPQSSVILSQLSTQISNYGSTTSDHYPVLARYNFNRIFTAPVPSTGVSNLSTVEFTVYPNPASNYVTIQSEDAIQQLFILDNKGNIVEANHYSQTINTSNYKSGMYWIKVITQKGTGIAKFIVTE